MNSQYSRVVISQLGTGRAAGSLGAGRAPRSVHPPGHPATTVHPTPRAPRPPSPFLAQLRTPTGHQKVPGADPSLGARSSPALGADAAGPALDLAVHVRQARVVGFGLVGADLRAGGRGAEVGGAAEGLLQPPHAPLEAVGLLWRSSRGGPPAGSYRPPGDVVRPHVGRVRGRLLARPGGERRTWGSLRVSPSTALPLT